MVRRTLAGRVMLGIGAVGVVVSIVGSLVGLRLLTELERALAGSLGVSAEAVAALDSSVELAEDTVVLVERGLQQTESTTRDLASAFEDAETALNATADLSEQQVAGSVEAVEEALPTLIEVGAAIDQTLTALNAIPLGFDYRPDEPFDESLRSLQQGVDGLPAELREQAELIRDGTDSLGTVRAGTEEVADDLGALHATLGSALDLLREYSATASEARDLVRDSNAALGRQLSAARVLVVVLGATLLAGQIVPLGLGWLLRHPEAAAAFVAEGQG